MGSQRACKEAVGPPGPAPPWGTGRVGGAMKTEAGEVKFMGEVLALSSRVSQRFAVLWDGLSNHAQEKENTCTLYSSRLTVTPCRNRSIS